jgi:DNA-binding GntR family transcriptional regulator
MILSGELPPGARLRQVEIAERFSVSSTPVREAFATLAREGLVRQDTHRGVEVFRPSVRDLQENFEIRLELEPLAAELAATRLQSTDLGKLERLLKRMERARRHTLATDLNRDFHLTIYRAASRPQLLDLIERLRTSADVFVRLLETRASSAYSDAVRDEHRQIFHALQTQSPSRARLAMAQHLQHNLAEITRLLEPVE